MEALETLAANISSTAVAFTTPPLPDGVYDGPGVNVSGDYVPFCNVCDPSGPPSPSYKVYNMVMTGILLPTVGLFGLLGNTISAYVFTRPRMLSSMNLYLCALAVSDICVITTAFFLFFMEGMRRYNATIARMFGAGAPVFFPSGLAAQTCSVYFTVAAAIDCFLQVLAPKSCVLRYCTKRRALAVIALIVLLSAAYNITHCFEVAVVQCWDPKFDALSLQVCMTSFRMDPLYLEIYYVYGYTIVMAVGPLVVLVIINAIIIIALAVKKQRKKREPLQKKPHTTTATTTTTTTTTTTCCHRQHSTSPNGHLPSHVVSDGSASNGRLIPGLPPSPPRSPAPNEEEEEVDAITLILVVCLFIFCNSLALIINFLEQTYYDQLGEALNYLVDISNLFVVCNSSANILFYYFFGDSFRHTLQALCRRTPSKRSRTGSQTKAENVNGYAPVLPHGSLSPSLGHRSPPPLPDLDDDDGSLSASIPLYMEEPLHQSRSPSVRSLQTHLV